MWPIAETDPGIWSAPLQAGAFGLCAVLLLMLGWVLRFVLMTLRRTIDRNTKAFSALSKRLDRRPCLRRRRRQPPPLSRVNGNGDGVPVRIPVPADR